MDEMRFIFLFGQQVLESWMVRKNNDICANKIRMELVKRENYGKHFFFVGGVIDLSGIKSFSCIVNDMRLLFFPLRLEQNQEHHTLLQKGGSSEEPG